MKQLVLQSFQTPVTISDRNYYLVYKLNYCKLGEVSSLINVIFKPFNDRAKRLHHAPSGYSSGFECILCPRSFSCNKLAVPLIFLNE